MMGEWHMHYWRFIRAGYSHRMASSAADGEVIRTRIAVAKAKIAFTKARIAPLQAPEA